MEAFQTPLITLSWILWYSSVGADAGNLGVCNLSLSLKLVELHCNVEESPLPTTTINLLYTI